MDPFRTNFLNHADLILEKKKPSAKALLELLRLATPGLKERDVTKNSAFRALQARLHPDKHPQDPQRATRLFKEVKLFYEECSKPSASSDTSFSGLLPFEFEAKRSIWSHIEYDHPYYEDDLSEEQVATLVAFQCINARGAIAHGKQIELRYQNKQIMKEFFQDEIQGVEATFNERGGCKTIDSVHEIKQEIFSNGPIVSASFCFSHNDAYFFPHLKAFVTQKAILIVGWKVTEVGEVWLVQPLARPAPIGQTAPAQAAAVPIAMGQFGIDDLCLAPADSFENYPWEEGPYLDIDLSPDVCQVWRTWSGIDTSLPAEQYLDLSKRLGRISFGPTGSTQLVTVREKDKVARSKKGKIEWIEWQEEENVMKVSVTYV